MAALSPSQVSNDRTPFHLCKDSYGISIRRLGALVSASSPHVDMDFPVQHEAPAPRTLDRSRPIDLCAQADLTGRRVWRFLFFTSLGGVVRQGK